MVLEFEKISVQKLTLYYKKNNADNIYHQQSITASTKKYSGRFILFDLKIPPNQQRTFYIQLKTNWGNTFPIKIATRENTLSQLFNEELFNGIYIGILFIMVFYNMFIYFTIRDKSYIYYVLYIFSFLLFQFNELGYAYKFFWVYRPELFSVFTKFLPTLSCITAVFFIRYFLETRRFTPKMDKVFNYILIVLILSLVLIFKEEHNSISFLILNVITLFSALYTLVICILILRKGFKPAKYFLIAWTILLLSIIQFNLSNLSIIPYYSFTDHSLEIGSVIEVFLLSLGLAYRIHELRKEKELSQKETINLIEEKKDIIKNQNVILENLVTERTKKLELRNEIILKKNEEKSIMMREIHHRVKNNLQMINSMVRMQSRHIDKENAADSLKEVERRIQTMALLHEKMYQTENLASINIKEYITAVLKDLLNIFHNDIEFEYKIDIPDINFKTESVLYIGLLINELITNSLKHGFTKQDEGYIYIKLHQTNSNEYLLNVSNNGEKINVNKFNNSYTLGQRLIKNFVKQLNGTLTIQSNEDISTFSIHFQEL